MNNILLSLNTLNISFTSIGSIVVALLVLLFMITVHEFGHYIVAKIFKFQVNEFAIGMGPALYKKKKKNGELFSIRLLPLGGYCAFEGEDEQNDNPNAFNNKKPYQRILVLIAGATMNFLTAILIFILSFSFYGQMSYQAYEVMPSASPYVLQQEDVILSLNGKDIYISTDLIDALKGCKQGDMVNALVYRKGKQEQIEIKLTCDPTSNSLTDYSNVFKSLNIATLTGVSAHVNGDGTGLKFEDFILRSNKNVTFYPQSELQNNSGDYYECKVLENGEWVNKAILISEYNNQDRLFGKEDIINYFKSLKVGDDCSLFISRGGERLLLTTKVLEDFESVDKNDESALLKYFNVLELQSSYRVTTQNVKLKFFQTIGHAFVYAFKNVSATFVAIGQIFSGKLGLSALSGPVSTISLTSQYVMLGFNYLLEIAGFIGVSLAIFNLLPIPALDGARAVFVLVEWIRKKPVNRNVEGVIHTIGLVALLLFAIMVDLVKCF